MGHERGRTILANIGSGSGSGQRFFMADLSYFMTESERRGKNVTESEGRRKRMTEFEKLLLQFE